VAGYAASGTLHGAVPEFVAMGGRTGSRRTPVSTSASASAPPNEPMADPLPIDLVGRPLDAVIGDWLAAVGESWSQLTFFLFDPQSWR
jgi:hypothetical protein